MRMRCEEKVRQTSMNQLRLPMQVVQRHNDDLQDRPYHLLSQLQLRHIMPQFPDRFRHWPENEALEGSRRHVIGSKLELVERGANMLLTDMLYLREVVEVLEGRKLAFDWDGIL